jgi:hypothetical protein
MQKLLFSALVISILVTPVTHTHPDTTKHPKSSKKTRKNEKPCIKKRIIKLLTQGTGWKLFHGASTLTAAYEVYFWTINRSNTTSLTIPSHIFNFIYYARFLQYLSAHIRTMQTSLLISQLQEPLINTSLHLINTSLHPVIDCAYMITSSIGSLDWFISKGVNCVMNKAMEVTDNNTMNKVKNSDLFTALFALVAGFRNTLRS